MSTPSTATATLHPHNFYPHHPTYQPASRQNYPPLVNGASRLNGYNTANSASSDLHRPASAATRQLPPLRNTGSSSEMQSTRRKKPDWNEFYKHGVPKEVIVIEDSPEPQFKKSVSTQVDLMAIPPVDSLDSQKPSYSTTQTPYYDNSSSNQVGTPKSMTAQSMTAQPDSEPANSPTQQTASTDRTASAYNTTITSTSLGSQASNGALAAYDEAVGVGQKRKRTRAEVDDTRVAKKRETRESPYVDYRPPRKPLIKAKDVYVEPIVDKTHRKDQKVDDDDGHFIVVPDTDLTERCKSPSYPIA